MQNTHTEWPVGSGCPDIVLEDAKASKQVGTLACTMLKRFILTLCLTYLVGDCPGEWDTE